MAQTNISAKIQLEGEQQFKNSIKQINAQSKTLSTEMKKVTSEFEKNGNAIQKNAKQREVLKKQIENQKKAFEENQKQLSKYTQQLSETDNPSTTLLTNIEKTTQAMNNAEAQINKMESQLKNLPSTLEIVGNKFKDVGKGMTEMGSNLTRKLTLPIAGLATYATKNAIEFEDAMAKVSTIADTSKTPLSALEKQIVSLSNETGIASSEIAESVYSAISAGQETEDAVKFVESANKLALAGFTDSAVATDVLTTALNAYGMSADQVAHVSDTLITTQNLGKTTVGELGASLGKIIPTANMTGVSFEELNAMMAITTKNGISTRISTTALNSMLSELSATDSKLDKALKSQTESTYGVAMGFKDMMENGYSVGDALKLVDDYARKNGQSFGDMFGQQAVKGAQTLLSNVEELADFTQQMLDSSADGGATAVAFEKMQTSSFKLKKTLNELKNTSVELGSTILEMLMPYFETFAQKVQQFSQWFSNLDDSTKRMIVTIAGIVAIAGPLLVIVGTVISSIGTILTAVTALGGAMALLTTPIGAVVLGITGLIALGALLIAHWDEVKAYVLEMKDNFMNNINEIWTSVSTFVSNVVSSVGQMVADMASGVLEKIEFFKSSIGQLIQGALDKIAEFFNDAKQKGKDLVDKVKDGAEEVKEQIKSIGSNIVSGVWQGISEKAKEFRENVSNFFSNIVDGVKSTLGINSPSKVFAEIGKFMGQGLEMGWQNELSKFNPSADLTAKIPSVNSVAGIDGVVGNNYSFNPNINLYGDYHERDGYDIAMSLDRWLGGQVV